MTQPNILWICTDQQRWDTLSFLGHAGARTPNIDRLAAEGTAFNRAYCQSPICTPSRASFLSGKYPIATGVQRNGNESFPDHIVLVPRKFRDAGYHTGLIGKLHLSRAQGVVENRPTDDGYEEFYWSHHPDPDWPEGHDYQDWLTERGVDAKAIFDPLRSIGPGVKTEDHQTTWAGDRAQRFMRRNAGKPWFLSINLFDPHPPFDPPAEYLAKFDRAEMPAPVFAASDLEHQERLYEVDQQARVAVDPRRGDPDLDHYEAPAPRPEGANHDTPPETYDGKLVRAAYHAMIALIDDMVGALLGVLDETGQRKDTIVLFMSDHGEMLGDHGLIYKGSRFYEGLVHVPMIFSWPGRVRAGVVSEALVELVDLPQTLLEAAGMAAGEGMQGKSLWPLLTGVVPADFHKPYVLCEYSTPSGCQSPGTRGRACFSTGATSSASTTRTEPVSSTISRDDPAELTDLWEEPGSLELRLRLTARAFDALMLASEPGPRRTGSY